MKNEELLPYTLLVNSSDGFEDCWHPFFLLLKKYWPECKCKILLNTEFKDYSYVGLDLTASKVNFKFAEKLTWSQCLIEALNQIDTPLVLYFQEDYFIEKPVLIEVIDEFANVMVMNPGIAYIGLTHFGNFPPFTKWEFDERLWVVSNKSRYRISTQVGLWRKETLLSYLRPEENGWMFEIFGTNRAKKRTELFLTANREIYSPQKSPIIQYLHTGIIKGKWHPLIPKVFAQNNVEIDYSKRGFYVEKSWFLRKMETFLKLTKNPVLMINGLRGK